MDIVTLAIAKQSGGGSGSGLSSDLSNISLAGEEKIKDVVGPIPTKFSDIENDNLKLSHIYGTGTYGAYLASAVKTLEDYKTARVNLFVGKGTLDNVLTEYMKAQALTQAEYDAIVDKDNNTLYVIVE